MFLRGSECVESDGVKRDARGVVQGDSANAPSPMEPQAMPAALEVPNASCAIAS